MAKLKMLKTGETDINSADIWRFAFHSDYQAYKIITSGVTTVTSNKVGGNLGYYGQVTIPHNLGYKPQSFIYADFSPFPPYPGDLQIKVTDVTGWYIYYYNDSLIYVVQYLDEVNQYLYIETPENGKTLDFGYIITLDEWQI